jgi:hypothetical protein
MADEKPCLVDNENFSGLYPKKTRYNGSNFYYDTIRNGGIKYAIGYGRDHCIFNGSCCFIL